MQRFLETCANYVFHKYSGDFRDICLVFPNRRAGVFFTAYLQKLLSKPVIGPEITTINELMHSISPLQPADRLLLISVLYDVFKKETGTKDKFDDFYFWGEVLLADFDDIDKYLVNAEHLFQNIAEVKEIESYFDYLTPDQKATIERFWGALKNWEKRDHERSFVSLWSKLHGVYTAFRLQLVEKQIGYSGMIMRDGVENSDKLDSVLSHKRYIFMGLNALNRCEKSLFSRLYTAGRAEFYWDYDSYYLQNQLNDAGKFLRENLQLFPAPDDFPALEESFKRPKQIEIISVPSAAGQSQVIPAFFELIDNGEPGKKNFDQTAVVLADESLLFPVLGALPAGVDAINVTMGYPVQNSPVSGFIYLLSALIRNTVIEPGKPGRLYFRMVTDILNHQLLAAVEPQSVQIKMRSMVTENRIYLEPEELHFSPVHRLIFSLPTTVSGYPGYFLGILEQLYRLSGDSEENLIVRELIYHIYLAMEKLQAALLEVEQTDSAAVSPVVFFRLMNQYLGQLSVPFEGEPLSGLQVMGILETRCLDFENLVIIGLNEEIWPRAYTAPSLIPYNLRKSFGLPGIDDQDAMYAYYFYRLIQRAQRVTATWNTIRDGVSGGELSRYGAQLKLLSPHNVVTRDFDYPFVSQTVAPITIPSGMHNSNKLLRMNASGRTLSPSAINTWLSCSLKFYFRYVLNIAEPDEVSEEIDRRVFGNIFHRAVENLYAPYVGRTLDRNTLKALRKDRINTDSCILRAFTTEYFKRPEGEAPKMVIEGKSMLLFSTIRSYIFNLLDMDARNAPITLHSLEGKFEAPIAITIGGEPKTIYIGGKIDRLDTVEGSLRVIDYKTGNLESGDLGCKQLEELHDPEIKKQKKEIVQALVYSLILKKRYFPDQKITSTIYAILKLNDAEFNPSIRVGGKVMEIGEILPVWEENLKDILEQIYSPDSVFAQTRFVERCGYCPYKLICGR